MHNVEEKRVQNEVEQSGGNAAEVEEARRNVLKNPDFHDASLSSGGHEQARQACSNFHTLLCRTHYAMPEIVFVSPLERALQTAKLLFPHLPLHCMEFLREKRTGEPCDERKPAAELVANCSHVDFSDILQRDEVSDSGYKFRTELRETNEQVALRAEPLLDFLRMQPGNAIAVVTHKGWLRELSRGPWANIADFDNGDLSSTFGNAEVRVCEVVWDRAGKARIEAHSLKKATIRPLHHVRTMQALAAEDGHGCPSISNEVMQLLHRNLHLGEQPHGNSLLCGGGLATAVGTSRLTMTAAWDAMQEKLGGPPSFAVVMCHDDVDARAAMTALRNEAGGAVVLGGSSSRGILTREGLTPIGILGFRGLAWKHGMGVAEGASTSSARKAGASAAKQACGGKYPDILIAQMAPGNEEDVLEGIRDVCGLTPIFGSSTSDSSIVNNTEPGRWWQLIGDLSRWEVCSDSVVVAALWLYDDVGAALFLSHLYGPTERKARITKASGRLLEEIDEQPAAEVLNEISGGAIQSRLGGGPILHDMARFPLSLEHHGHHRLVHARAVLKGGQVECFGPVAPGYVRFMHCKVSDVTGAAAALAQRASSRASFPVRGAMIAISAMTTAALEDSQLQELADAIAETLPDFFCFFTFGEQGMVLGASKHGNLMINVALFG